jgi:hypothetical protein
LWGFQSGPEIMREGLIKRPRNQSPYDFGRIALDHYPQ